LVCLIATMFVLNMTSRFSRYDHVFVCSCLFVLQRSMLYSDVCNKEEEDINNQRRMEMLTYRHTQQRKAMTEVSENDNKGANDATTREYRQWHCRE
jgi:hypothetical protein